MYLSCNEQRSNCAGKTGKMTKEIPFQGKHRELVNLANLFAQVVNSLILKIQDNAIFAANFSIISLKLNMSARQFCI